MDFNTFLRITRVCSLVELVKQLPKKVTAREILFEIIDSLHKRLEPKISGDSLLKAGSWVVGGVQGVFLPFIAQFLR